MVVFGRTLRVVNDTGIRSPCPLHRVGIFVDDFVGVFFGFGFQNSANILQRVRLLRVHVRVDEPRKKAPVSRAADADWVRTIKIHNQTTARDLRTREMQRSRAYAPTAELTSTRNKMYNCDKTWFTNRSAKRYARARCLRCSFGLLT